VLLVGALLVAIALVVARSAPGDSAEARASRLARELRCPVCQGLSVADSFEPTSEAIRAEINERVADGQSDAEILQVMVDRYGEDILLRPPSGGIGALAWGVPVAVLVLGAGGVLFAVRRWSRNRASTDGATAGGPPARRVLTVGVLVVVAVVAAAAAAQAVGERRPGEAATGNSSARAQTSGDSEEELRAAVEARPDDYAPRIALARFLLNNDPAGALREFDAAAALDPARAEPVAYGGWIVALVADRADEPDDRALLLERAVDRLDAAIEIDPEYEDAYVFKGLVLYQFLDDPAGAVPMFQRFLALAPQDHPMRGTVLSALERALDDAERGTETSSTIPPTTQEP
jgi:cytochrome c-type biogenesis protein CcmH